MIDEKKILDFKSLVAAGVHFGHPRTRRCPKMDQNIWGMRNDVQLIDVSKTSKQAELALTFLQETAAEGKAILWVGTKKAARGIIKRVAQQLGMPFVSHRWIGGSLTNADQVKKSITKLLHYEDILSKTDKASTLYTKKEFNVFQKIVERLERSVGGIRALKWPVGALVVVDVRKERSAIKEAHAMGIPVVALVDTDGDPTGVDYVIPANDDAPRSINLLIEYLAAGVARGKEIADKNEEIKKASKTKAVEASDLSLSEEKKLLEEELDAVDLAKQDNKVSRKGAARRDFVGGGKPREQKAYKSGKFSHGSTSKKSE